MKLKRIFFVLLMFTFVFSIATPKSFNVLAFFDVLEKSVFQEVAIGNFSFETGVQPWNPETEYEIGDEFAYNGALWRVRASGETTEPPEGAILQPHGVYQEITDEYRPYNTYFAGDFVMFEGIEYEALYNGMSGTTPGTATGWQALTDQWMPFNIYSKDDIVIFEGEEYQAVYNNVSGQPGQTSGWNNLSSNEWNPYNIYDDGDEVVFNGKTYRANWWNQNTEPSGNNVGVSRVWYKISGEIESGATTHDLNASILDGTIIIDGYTVVENGVIQTTEANNANISITKGSAWGAFFWEFQRGNQTIRLTPSNTIVYSGSGQLEFDSFFVSVP